MAKSVSSIDQQLNQHLVNLAAYASADHAGSVLQGVSKFFTPTSTDDWDGDVTDVDNISSAFDRSAIHEKFAGAVTSDDEGVSGDLSSLVLQGEMVAVLEQAFRARHLTSVRARMHAAARRKGHGDPRGPILTGALGYLQHLDRMAKS